MDSSIQAANAELDRLRNEEQKRYAEAQRHRRQAQDFEEEALRLAERVSDLAEEIEAASGDGEGVARVERGEVPDAGHAEDAMPYADPSLYERGVDLMRKQQGSEAEDGMGHGSPRLSNASPDEHELATSMQRVLMGSALPLGRMERLGEGDPLNRHLLSAAAYLHGYLMGGEIIRDGSDVTQVSYDRGRAHGIADTLIAHPHATAAAVDLLHGLLGSDPA